MKNAMKAATLKGIETQPVPKVGVGEVLIAIEYAGVGEWDLIVKKGIPGSDGAGVIVAKGSRVRRFKIGDYVYSYSYENPKGGFHAEYVAVDAHKVARPPKGLRGPVAGGIPTVGLTALQGVDDSLGLRAGESVIVHGASGNVGCIAIQFAKARGARVLAVASGRDGVRFVHTLGIRDAIDGHRDDIAAAARKFAPDGVDAVLGFAGGRQLNECIRTLRKGGRVAYPNGVEPPPKKRPGISIKAYDATPGVREFERLGRAIERYGLIIPIAKFYKLKDATKAYARLEKGHVLGKVVIRVR